MSEICVGLPISRQTLYTTNEIQKYFFSETRNAVLEVSYKQYDTTGSKAAMYFSIAVFTGLNLACFLVVGYCYLAIFLSARKTSKQAGRSTDVKEEIRMALKMFVIVFTDFCCWIAVGMYSILVQTGAVEDNPDVYVWIATFVLPINASLNPFLYTLASVISNKVIKTELVNTRLSTKSS